MTPAGQAQCAMHPDQYASRTCERCGNFMCEQCSVNGTMTLCPRCRLIAVPPFPFSRDNFDFSRIWGHAFEAFKREWVMLSVAVLIWLGANGAAGALGNVVTAIGNAAFGNNTTSRTLAIMGVAQVFVLVAQQVIQGIFQLGFLRVVMDVVLGGKADIARMFSQVSKMPSYVGQWLLAAVGIGLPFGLFFGVLVAIAMKTQHIELPSGTDPDAWLEAFGKAAPILSVGMLIAFLPLVWVSLPFLLVPMELTYGGAGAVESVRRVFILAKGQRLTIFGYTLVFSFVGGLGLFACCIGILPGLAFSQTGLTTLYLSLRTGSRLPAPIES